MRSPAPSVARLRAAGVGRTICAQRARIAQLGRRPAQEASRSGAARRRPRERSTAPRGAAAASRLDLELAPARSRRAAFARRRRARRRRRTHAGSPSSTRRHEQAELERAQPLELGERARDLLERSDPVAQPRGVLEAEVARRARVSFARSARQRVGRLALPAVERPRGEPRPAAALERPVRAGRARSTHQPAPRRRR